jgi:hypothetical protein
VGRTKQKARQGIFIPGGLLLLFYGWMFLKWDFERFSANQNDENFSELPRQAR